LRENKKKFYKCVDWEEKKTKHLEEFGEKDENEKKNKKKNRKRLKRKGREKKWENVGRERGDKGACGEY
jgi:hypothetical protein